MPYIVKLASTPEELEKIIALRYRILRAPWNQSIESASDDLEITSFNAYVEDAQAGIIACGRLQVNTPETGQVRYMAVHEDWQGKGLGKMILKFLEKKGKEEGLSLVELQARENAREFYRTQGYNEVEKTFRLWNIIQHYRMQKILR